MSLEIRRKLLHLSSLWIPVVVFFLNKDQALYVFVIFTVCLLIFDIVRYFSLMISYVSCLEKLFLREREAMGFRLSGGSWMLIAAMVTTLFFDKSIAFVGMLVLIISDTLAALVGTRWGSIRLFGKSLQGSLAFFVSSWLCIVLSSWLFGFSDWYVIALLVSLVATFVELFSAYLRIDDNFSIPVSVCLSIYWLLAL